MSLQAEGNLVSSLSNLATSSEENGGNGGELFPTIASTDFLGFEFNSRKYADQITEAIVKTKQLCAVSCRIRADLPGFSGRAMWMSHDFGFLGGSLGCAEGEKLVLGLEKAREERLPVIIECRSGGARMQEGTLALMQMAKVSVAIAAVKEARIPIITVSKDPTYGGVSASYAMQGDVRIGIKQSRIGFAGPDVILNTIYEKDQSKYDAECPQGFQSAEFLERHGQLDIVLPAESELDPAIGRLLSILWQEAPTPGLVQGGPKRSSSKKNNEPPTTTTPDYLQSRALNRYQSQDFISQIFEDFIELRGDGKVGFDNCIRGGVATLKGKPCIVFGTSKGHDPMKMKESNFGMASPHGYRLALRLMDMAEHFRLPVFTLVDTVGAYPSFESETNGQSEALATNLLKMASLTVPLISLVIGEGGSGGALGIAMGNRIGMLSKAYYSVISPEGAASILGRYSSEEQKAVQFPVDCRQLASVQKVFAEDLLKLGVIDEVIYEEDGETYLAFPVLKEKVTNFFVEGLEELLQLTPQSLVAERFSKFRKMGKFDLITDSDKKRIVQSTKIESRTMKRSGLSPVAKTSRTLNYIADRTLNSENSAFRGKAPKDMTLPSELKALTTHKRQSKDSAKWVLDHEGPEAVVEWVRKQNKILLTDTTMRDAHQSLLATRVRTHDLLLASEETSEAMADLYSLEMWGGATFDVAFRFLHESPWDRLRVLREKIPNILFQMLVRGANSVGYKSYPDNVVVQFIKLAARNGIDVFRIFDCFNDVAQMKLCIDAVKAEGKIAEVSICFTGNFLSPKEKIYTLEYYRNLTKEIVAAGAHMLAVKDMAGLLRPQMAKPLMEAIRSVTDLPIHYHTHNTSSASLATCLAMASHGCNIIDLCLASMADTTSQPSLNAFLASLEGDARDPGINYLDLERLDLLWANIRSVYSPFESGMLSGSARVYEHQIPGGQYSNLFAQCKSMGLMSRWGEVLDMYRDVNLMFGDIIKVTPSSKCVGDLALYLVTNNLTCADVITRGDELEFPESSIEFFKGEIGTPHMGFPKEVQAKVLKGRQPIIGRPGDFLPPADFDSEKKALEAKHLVNMTDEDVISSLLYPKVFEDYQRWRGVYGPKVQYLPSHVFFYGMTIGQEETFSVVEEDGKEVEYKLRLKRVGPLQQGGMRTLVFEVNGQNREAVVKDMSLVVSTCDLPRADPGNPRQIGSPLPGTVDKIYAPKGSEVHRGDKILTVSAMKMEVHVTAPFDGIVDEIGVKLTDKVDQGTLLATLTPTSEKKVSDMPRVESLASFASLADSPQTQTKP